MNSPARSAAVRFARSASSETSEAGRQTLTALDPDGRLIGQLDFQICHVCRRGLIHNVAVALHWRDQGVAREALHHVLDHQKSTDYAWSTTRQTSDGRRFFATMTGETDLSFPATSARCPHILTERKPEADGT
ncbi:GNAT family N-acetyltransferase [Streptomyces alboflavus]|uniref:GNAT family N-acetyltransferase n=1 Tax=Streptomyces alboflavus TaxID=67267 RepID=UPI003687648E